VSTRHPNGFALPSIVITYRFGQADLLRIRFAVSPVLELVGAHYAVRRPDRRHLHRWWAVRVADDVARLDLRLLDVATPIGGDRWPAFLGPPPVRPDADIDDDLRRVAATPPEQVVFEITQAYRGAVPPAGQPFLDDPAAALAELVEQMRTFWEVAVAPWWTTITALLEAEIAARARRLVSGGLTAVLGDLHPTVSWDGRDVLTVRPTSKAPAYVDLAGRGLLLVPAAFVWPMVWPRTDPPWDPALVFPPAGVGTLWNADTSTADPLAALLGEGRARVLRFLERAASTQELAGQLGASQGGISRHLTVLREAGLVTSRREGRWVVYSRTTKGDSLCGP